MPSVSAGHITLTPTQPVGRGQPQQKSNTGSPHQDSSALPTELQRPQIYVSVAQTALNERVKLAFIAAFISIMWKGDHTKMKLDDTRS